MKITKDLKRYVVKKIEIFIKNWLPMSFKREGKEYSAPFLSSPIL
jgi:hypothetical protein